LTVSFISEPATGVSEAMITVDKRKSRRLNVLHSGFISFENGDGISCKILNMSPFGACLELGTSSEVSKTFVLGVEADHIRWRCRLIWRAQTQVGVAFE
jgi:hypothetical protein